MAWYAVRYAIAAAPARAGMRGNEHHRDLGVAEAARWIRGGWRKAGLRLARDRGVLRSLAGPARSKRWFAVALQVHNDAQIREHSPFADASHVIETVMALVRRVCASTRRAWSSAPP